MTPYSIALFIHIVGALAFFAAVGLELAVLGGLRHARTVEHVRVWLQTGRTTRTLFRFSLALLLAAGLYLALTVWGIWTPWIDATLVTLAIFNVVAPLVNGRRYQAVGRLLSATGGGGGQPLPAGLVRATHDPVLQLSVHVMAAVSLGIVFLMTVKPDLLGSVVALGTAALCGSIWAVARAARSPHGDLISRATAKSEHQAVVNWK